MDHEGDTPNATCIEPIFSFLSVVTRKFLKKNLFLVVAVVVLVLDSAFFSPRYWLSNGC